VVGFSAAALVMMDATSVAAAAYCVATAAVVLFQFALALGAPWGRFAMGGAFPGRFPTGMRFAAAAQGLLLLASTGVVLSRAGVALPSWGAASSWLIWVVVAFGALSALLNLITPSPAERRLWAPVAIVMFVSSLTVALTAG
jgi:hypothetical protein